MTVEDLHLDMPDPGAHLDMISTADHDHEVLPGDKNAHCQHFFPILRAYFWLFGQLVFSAHTFELCDNKNKGTIFRYSKSFGIAWSEYYGMEFVYLWNIENRGTQSLAY